MNNIVVYIFILSVVLCILCLFFGFYLGASIRSRRLKNIIDREIEESRGTDNGQFLGLCRASKIISDNLK